MQGGYICAEFRLSISQAFIVYARRWDARTSGGILLFDITASYRMYGRPDVKGGQARSFYIYIFFKSSVVQSIERDAHLVRDGGYLEIFYLTPRGASF